MINWISTKEVSKLPDTDRNVIVLIEGSQNVITAKFNPEVGWYMISADRRSEGWPAAQPSVKFWSDYNLPK